MTTWAWMGLELFLACYQITLASCPFAGTQKFHKVCVKSVLLSLAFFVGIVFCCWIPLLVLRTTAKCQEPQSLRMFSSAWQKMSAEISPPNRYQDLRPP